MKAEHVIQEIPWNRSVLNWKQFLSRSHLNLNFLPHSFSFVHREKNSWNCRIRSKTDGRTLKKFREINVMKSFAYIRSDFETKFPSNYWILFYLITILAWKIFREINFHIAANYAQKISWNQLLVVYDRNRIFGRNFRQNWPKYSAESFGQPAERSANW